MIAECKLSKKQIRNFCCGNEKVYLKTVPIPKNISILTGSDF